MTSSLNPLIRHPTVSCVLTFLNIESFLAEAIDSVLNQTYENWELFLVDDGSTDQSTQIAQQYAQAYPQKVTYLSHLHHQCRGKNASRNLGIKQASGELVALLKGDDVWLPNKLAEQVVLYQQYPEAGMIYGRTQQWFSWVETPEARENVENSSTQETLDDRSIRKNAVREELKDPLSQYKASLDTLVAPPSLLVSMIQDIRQAPYVSSMITQRGVFDAVGYFDECYHHAFEEVTFAFKVASIFPVLVSDKCWDKARQESALPYDLYKTAPRHYDTLRGTLAHLQFFGWVEAYLEANRGEGSRAWKVLQNRQRQLRKLQQVQNMTTLRLWRKALELSMSMGKRALPKSLRHWLWKSIGEQMYNN